MNRKLKEKIKQQLLKEIEILKDERGFLNAGFPIFKRLFGRDSLIASWQLLDTESEICKKTLEILSQLQGEKIDKKREEEPGKILHETDFKLKYHPQKYFPFPYYGSIDSTLLFLILFAFYYKKTKDIRFLKEHWGNIIRALNWTFNFGDRDKDLFLEYQRKTEKGLFHQGWKDGFENHLKISPPVAIVEVQGYQYLALKEIAEASKIIGDNKLKKSLLKRAKTLKKKFNNKFWMPNKKYFCLALNGKKLPRRVITSNPGHLLFTGICDKKKEKLLIKRLFQKDLWTDYGIRTFSALEPDFNPRSYHLGSIWPHDNWIIAQGLKKIGRKKEYRKIKNAILKTYQAIGFLPELYSVVNGKVTINLERRPCHPQAWATGALLNFLQDF